MKPDFVSFVRKLARLPYLAELLALAIGCGYAWRLFIVAHLLDLNMDEGTYLMKGLLFTNGSYTPYQAYGPWTQKMPLAYYLFGWAEQIFAPGLRTGRYLACFFALLALVGLWLALRRNGGRWLAVLGVIYLTANSAGLVDYAYAATQAIVACLVAWTLALGLGKARQGWEILLAAALAGLLAITRQNMIPFSALFAGYLFWLHGRRTGASALGVMGLIFIFPHLVFWPNILALWTALPRALTPFLDSWRISLLDQPTIIFDVSSFETVRAFLEGIRFYFLPFFGAICSVLLAPGRSGWKEEADYKTYVFLGSAWFSLLLVHIAASFWLNYGAYTFSSYISFFQAVGLVMVGVSYRYWQFHKPSWKTLLLGLVAAALTAAAAWLTDFLLDLPVPRIRDLAIQPGMTELWRLLANKSGYSRYELSWLVPIPAGFALAVLIIVAGGFLLRRKGLSAAAIYAGGLLILGLLLSPLPLLGYGRQSQYCSFDVIAANEQIGQHARSAIPAGSTVYWYPWLAPTPLLYLENPQIFPPQLDNEFTYIQGTDTDTIERLGFWNAELAERWLAASDYLLIADSKVGDFLQEQSDRYLFDEVEFLPVQLSCREKSFLHIYQVIPLQP